MRRKIKHYFVFTSVIYRIVIFGALPLVLLGAAVFLAGKPGYGWPLLPACAPVLMVLAEVVADNWMFGGLHGRDAEKMDLLKTSGRGMKIMRDALTLDLLRRLFTLAEILAICLLAEIAAGKGIPAGDWPKLLCAALISYDISVLGTWAARFGSAVWINIVIGYAGTAAAGVALVIIAQAEVAAVSAAALAIAGVFLSALTVRTAMKKVEGGYYDK